MTKLLNTLMIVAALTGACKIYRETIGTPRHLDLPLTAQYIQGPELVPDRPALVELWATWCGPCQESVPYLNELKRKYGGRGLQIVGITEESEPAISSFMRQIPIQYSVCSDSDHHYGRALSGRSDPTRLPWWIPQGHIVWHGHPMTLPGQTFWEKFVAQPIDKGSAQASRAAGLRRAEKLRPFPDRLARLAMRHEIPHCHHRRRPARSCRSPASSAPHLSKVTGPVLSRLPTPLSRCRKGRKSADHRAQWYR